MKVSLPDPAVLACFDTSASSCNDGHNASGAQQLRGPTSLLNNSAFVAETGMAPASLNDKQANPMLCALLAPCM